MRRVMLLLMAGGLVLGGCSSSKKDANSDPTPSVEVAKENVASCADLKAYFDALKANQATLGETGGAEGARNLQQLYASLLPSIEKAQASASPAVAPSLGTIANAFKNAATLDPNSAVGQQLLATLLLSPPADVRAALDSIDSYAKSTCGLSRD